MGWPTYVFARPATEEETLLSLKSLIQTVMLDRRGKIYHKILTFIFRKKLFLTKEDLSRLKEKPEFLLFGWF